MSQISADTVTAKTTNTNLTLIGNGTGKVAIGDGSLLMPDADGSAGQFIKTDGSGTLSFDTVASGRTIEIEQKALGYYASTSINGSLLPTGWAISHTLANSANALMITGYASTYNPASSGNVYVGIELRQDGTQLTESAAPDSSTINYYAYPYFSSQNYRVPAYIETIIKPGDTSSHDYQLYVYGNTGAQSSSTTSWSNAFIRITEIDGSIVTVA